MSHEFNNVLMALAPRGVDLGRSDLKEDRLRQAAAVIAYGPLASHRCPDVSNTTVRFINRDDPAHPQQTAVGRNVSSVVSYIASLTRRLGAMR